MTEMPVEPEVEWDYVRYPPPGGFHPQDFPQVTVASIPYTSDANLRADPHMVVLPDGWLFIESGNVRVAIPDRQEWHKFATMVDKLWNAHELKLWLDAKAQWEVQGDVSESPA